MPQASYLDTEPFEIVFKILSLLYCESQGAEILTECSPSTARHILYVTCHMLHVVCQVFYWVFFNEAVELVVGGSVIKGPYPAQFLIFTQPTSSPIEYNNHYIDLCVSKSIFAIDVTPCNIAKTITSGDGSQNFKYNLTDRQFFFSVLAYMVMEMHNREKCYGKH